MNENVPSRKALRYKHFDYNEGIVFITICTSERKQILSKIVGDGASTSLPNHHSIPKIQLTEIGKIVDKYINSSNNMENISIGDYVIMPNHIHMLVVIKKQSVAQIIEAQKRNVEAPNRDVEAPSPTKNKRQNLAVPRFVSALKRLCNKEIGENIFQRSYFDHIIRSNTDLDRHIDYILHNPENWFYDELYSAK